MDFKRIEEKADKLKQTIRMLNSDLTGLADGSTLRNVYERAESLERLYAKREAIKRQIAEVWKSLAKQCKHLDRDYLIDEVEARTDELQPYLKLLDHAKEIRAMVKLSEMVAANSKEKIDEGPDAVADQSSLCDDTDSSPDA